MAHLSMHSPLGQLTIFEDQGSIVALDFGRAVGPSETPLLLQARDQLDAYFGRERQDFDLPLAPQGSEFQRAVWDQMCTIPYGAAATYGDIAGALNSAARAVGGACGANPIPVIIPCHRVIGASGRMTGYSGGEGIETKLALLRLEGYRLL
ncbi:MAG: methylated-DNA--[protein]-cysteine S-methyltransferase [Rhodospirillaceae bacterium]|mgnify:FL=1|jgi:methylated-DNA-[protein]-cysteine S-methyltransferase|nr:methylated-DNA--[protein]-cysteine S-methyltransferase [Rhodospirillaceae bacterium]MBT3886153.1 methylated-DNA--[protein]-cysteine S-methyltransferase [Rhodospirillaceae bacterium]MBT4118224.1 methylated-DNA--[protein]-cysteine S-methyltransferase [Rhodospirillaceae bacterium]MBT4673067.1 methylated-DNA--[protein]-cysteine S-methyltransferase [Rhodospirillaceae bacterium]MBT4721331.1 methylated-DNA--[protein]-cysteine S-methyltransferase [Rhodospirillaceae bacterium]